ncbi:MAG TPA: outer membrane beta-barrel protein [Bacteroidales bacterium]|nr:outer membrane beta-barrel protein [Bacteroidales bacterium]
MNVRQENTDPVDDLFRSGLEDYEVTPSPGRREALLQEISSVPEKRSPKYPWIIGSLVLILAGSLSWLMLSGPSETKNPSKRPVKMMEATQAVPALSNLKHSESYQPSKQTPTEVIYGPTSSNIQSTVNPAKPKGNQNSATVISLPAATTGIRESSETLSSAITGIDTSVTTKDIRFADTLMTSANNSAKTEENPPEPQKPVPDPKAPQPEKQRKTLNLSVGVNYSPEWMFNVVDKAKYVNNIGVEGSYHFGPYSIRTGVGLSITNGYNEILVRTNPYLGSYQLLDSISFRWDDRHYHLIPTIFTSGKEVFDTIQQLTYSENIRKYTYLQIPLVLGYDFLQRDRFSIGFRAGAVMSVLLNTKTLSESYDPGKDHIITMNKVTPERIKLNWQAIGGINVSFRMSERFRLELEPEVRYYFNSVFEKAEISKMPWSAGCRAAILIDF